MVTTIVLSVVSMVVVCLVVCSLVTAKATLSVTNNSAESRTNPTGRCEKVKSLFTEMSWAS